MGMATNTDDPVRVAAPDFRRLCRPPQDHRSRNAPDLRGFDILSMGMSHDYRARHRRGPPTHGPASARNIRRKRDYAK